MPGCWKPPSWCSPARAGRSAYEAIGARAGVTRGAVHHHFRDKTRLQKEAISAGWRRHAAPALSELSCEDRPPVQRLAGFLSRYLCRLSQDESFRALAIVSVLVAPQVVDVGEGMRGNAGDRPVGGSDHPAA
ncbi:TetR/AcrR family transcriptional regulator [Nonomuraea polychroma]|uniref:TetR/AcrR family transcriptional regulator n=1 Tax=Nonomuraea polychroma TaxID=46176 RepID=UPI003D8D3095